MKGMKYSSCFLNMEYTDILYSIEVNIQDTLEDVPYLTKTSTTRRFNQISTLVIAKLEGYRN